jgi:hypothetical protein
MQHNVSPNGKLASGAIDHLNSDGANLGLNLRGRF